MRVAMMDFTNVEARSVSTLDSVLMPAQHGALCGLTNVTQINQAWFQERLRAIKLSQRQPDDLLDRLCLVALSDGRMVSAILRRGYEQRLFNLVLMPDNGVLENQEVAWAAHVMWIQPT